MLPGEKLLSINDELAVQSRWYHFFKMCQITLITRKGSVSYIARERDTFLLKRHVCDCLLVTKRLCHAEVARHFGHVTLSFSVIFLYRK